MKRLIILASRIMEYRFLLPVLAMAAMQSCISDPVMECYLSNDTGDTIRVSLQLDTLFLKEKRSDSPLRSFLDLPYSAGDTGMIVLKTDSAKYSKEFYLAPGCMASMDGGIKSKPSVYFSEMRIYHRHDSLVITGRENISRAFVKEGLITYMLRIK